MNLSCPSCAFTTSLPDGQEPPEGVRATCPSCGRVSIYLRGGLVDDQPTPPQGLEPFPLRPAPQAPSTVAPPTSGWRLRTLSGEEGPHGLDVIKTMIRTGSLHADDQALAPDDSEWRRAGDFPTLARYFKLKESTPSTAAPATSAGATPCFMHPSRACQFLCTSCGTTTCAECVVEREIRMLKVKLCPRCERPVQAWVPTKLLVPFWKDLPGLLAYPVKGLAIIGPILCAMLGTGASLAFAVGGLYSGAGALALMACIIAFHLMIIRNTCQGGRTVPDLSGLEDVWREMVWPGARGFAVTVLVFLGASIWAARAVAPAEVDVGMRAASVEMAREDREAFERGDLNDSSASDEGEDDSESDERSTKEEAVHALDQLMAQGPGGEVALPGLTYHDETRDLDYYVEQERLATRDLADAKSALLARRIVFGLLILIAYVMWPIFLIVVALFNTVMPALQPAVLVRVIGEIPKEYAWCVAFTTACFIIAQLVTLPFAGIPIIGGWASNPVSYYFSFIAFHVMGRTAEMAEQKIDWS